MSAPSLLWWLYEHAPAQAEGARLVGLACLACYRQRRVAVSLLRGRARSGAPATVLAAGPVDFLAQHIFVEAPAREALGAFPWWTLRRRLRSWQQRVDLTLACVPGVVASGIAGHDYLVVPEWLSMRVPVPDDLHELRWTSGSVRQDLRIVRRNRLTHTVAPALTDIDHFYEQMYVPLIRRRYGATTSVRGLRHVRALGRRGGFVWIERDGQRVAGLLFQERGREMRVLCIGTLNGEYSPVKAGAVAGLYLAVLEHAWARGLSAVDLGGTRASLTDGLFRYKRKWGGTITRNEDSVSAFLVRWERWNDVVAGFLGCTGLVLTDGQRFDAVRVVADGQPAGLAHRECWTAGLRRLYLINPRGWAGADSPPDTTLLDAPADGTLSSSGLVRGMSEARRRGRPASRTSAGGPAWRWTWGPRVGGH
jgi:hypothetical protein